MACSNILTGILNLVTLVFSLPIIAVGIWLAKQHNTVCYHFLEWPVIAIGGFILVVSLVGMLGAWCNNFKSLLVPYLIVMFVLIAFLFVFTIFAFVVTNTGGGDAVPGKGFQVPRFLLLSVSLCLSVYSQKAKLKIKSTKLKCFSRLSIAKIRPKFERKFARFLYMVQLGSQKYRMRF